MRRAFAGVDLTDLDPFVHMDQMGEVEYAPGEPKGTPWHPHRGFETVTYIIDGVFDHHDSHGGGGSITNGDTQWMTAGAGLLHIETPPEWLVQSGGLFHGIQLWVNLPRDAKWNPPAYQDIRSAQVGLATSRRRRRAGARDRRRGRCDEGSRHDVHPDHAGARHRRGRARASTCRGTSPTTRSSTCCPGRARSATSRSPCAPATSPCSAPATSSRCRPTAARRAVRRPSTCSSSAAARSASRSRGPGRS